MESPTLKNIFPFQKERMYEYGRLDGQTHS